MDIIVYLRRLLAKKTVNNLLVMTTTRRSNFVFIKLTPVLLSASFDIHAGNNKRLRAREFL